MRPKIHLERIQAVLFDFDGVIADTMEDNFKAWKKAFQTYRIEIASKDYFPLEGMHLLNVARTLGEKYGLSSQEAETLVTLKNKFYAQEHIFRFYPGIHELISFLKEKQLLLAIVSASPREKLSQTVPKDFLREFDSIIAGEDTLRGKPSPDPYLAAAKNLRISPERCLVIENAPLGIQAAKGANMYCIALPTTLDRGFLQEADLVLENLEEVKSFLN